MLVPLIKGDRMDLCVEKLVEVGADELVVWPAARSVVKLDAARRPGAASPTTPPRSSQQPASPAARIPTLALVDSRSPPRLAALPEGECQDRPRSAGGAGRDPVDDRDRHRERPRRWPERPAEHDALAAAGFSPLGLGPRVLRAETRSGVIAVGLVRAATNS